MDGQLEDSKLCCHSNTVEEPTSTSNARVCQMCSLQEVSVFIASLKGNGYTIIFIFVLVCQVSVASNKSSLTGYWILKFCVDEFCDECYDVEVCFET